MSLISLTEVDEEVVSANSNSENCFSVNELIGIVGLEGVFTGNANVREDNPVNISQVQHVREENQILMAEVHDAVILDGSLTPTVCEAGPSNTIRLDPEDHVESPGDLESGRKRKRKADKSTWFQQVNKSLRMKGEEYVGYKITEGGPKTKTQRKGTSMKPSCNSQACRKNANRYCERFTENDRQNLFLEFWKQLDWNQKRAYVISHVDKRKTVRQTKPVPTRRQEAFQFHLKLMGQRRRVCRTMFLNTLGLKPTQVRNWVTKNQLSRKKRVATDAPPDARKQSAKDYFNMLPKIPSHYCRRSSSKLYLEPPFRCKQDVYKQYVEFCGSSSLKPLGRKAFLSVMDEANIAIFTPRKDRCDTCCSYEAGNLSKEEYDAHVLKKDLAQQEKATDKKNALHGTCHVLTMDLQAVQICPVLNASSLYYKTKLMVHNFTIYDLSNGNVTCYLWNESDGGLVASVFASMVTEYLSDYKDNKPIIIYSDGCTNQNRNAMMSNALLWYSVKTKKVVIQKFLEKGHTMMEVDSVHSAIERKLKGRQIYAPSDYIQICETARQHPRPYNVRYLAYNFFQDYSKKANQMYTSIKPSSESGGACVTNIRQLKYDPAGTIQFKLDHGEEEWSNLPRRAANATDDFPSLYSSRLKISKRKYKDLCDLLEVIPVECHDFYKNLPN